MAKQLLKVPHTWAACPRDLAEQELCNRILGDPDWTAWCDTLTDLEYDDYIAFLLVQMGINTKLDSYNEKRRVAREAAKRKKTK